MPTICPADVNGPLDPVHPRLIAEIRNLSVSYPPHSPVLRDICLTLNSGDRLGLAGESGCGKTTLLRAIVGLLPESARVAGDIAVHGAVGYIPQEGLNSLSPFLTAGRQVSDLTRSSHESMRLLAEVGLGNRRFYNACPHQLSGGERQRVLIAQALAVRPQLIVADEPTANLDSKSEALVLHLLDSYARQTGAAILIASHRESVFRQLDCTVRRMTPAAAALQLATSEPQPERPPLLSIRNLTKIYPRPILRALDGVSLDVRCGEFVAVTGPSGAGKSTLARCLAGREPWDSGSIEWHADAPDPGPERVQMVQQEPSESLNPRFSIGAAIREAGAPDDPELLAHIGLPQNWWGRKVSALSEGQRARVAILRTASRLNGGILILDESLTGLDPATRSSILSYLDGLRKDRGVSLLLITHDLEVAQEAGARVLQLSAGRMEA